MKSNVASSVTARARSLRNTDAPFSTATKIIDWPPKSRVMSAPISATRCAICSRENKTFSSGMGAILITAQPRRAQQQLHCERAKTNDQRRSFQLQCKVSHRRADQYDVAGIQKDR